MSTKPSIPENVKKYLKEVLTQEQYSHIAMMINKKSLKLAVLIKGPSGATGKSTLCDVLNELGINAYCEDYVEEILLDKYIESGKQIKQLSTKLFLDR